MRAVLSNPAWRPIPFVLALAAIVHPRGVPVDPQSPGRSASLAKAMAASGLTASAGDVTWLEDRGDARAIVRAVAGEDPPALYFVRAHLSPEGVLLDAGTPRKLTRSNGIEERPPIVHGNTLATALVADGQVLSLQVVDLEREPPVEGPAWTPLARVQNALTNLQETGQFTGFGRRVFRLVPPATEVALAFDHGSLVVKANGKEGRVPEVLPPGTVDADDELLKAEPSEKGQVGNLVTWAVDRVRAMPWFGDENMQRVKAVAFGALDIATIAKSKVAEDDTAKDIANDMGDVGAKPSLTDPETGWPPAPLAPFLSKPLPGEGEWELLDNDPFVRVNPGAPAAFARTYVRTDRERAYTRIYITAWDPRQVELHPVAGTVEPVSATGAAGPGVIPRTPQTMKHLVAATNGGFQAMHGEFGMMADGTVYLPPKPYAATIAELADGSTAFGVWPGDTTTIPIDIVGYRQNLTPLVQNEKFNPWGRTWWGGTPPGWPDRVHTTRSGMCLTKEGFVAYFYGNGIDADVLAQAMIQARCKLGLHLDMNPGHTGLEFYRADQPDLLASLGRPLQRDWEGEGDVGDMGYRFIARRMVRGMGLMNFPRYIQRESRDFFYLTLRPVLPGNPAPPLAEPAEPNEGAWRTKGLPQGGFPSAIATTLVRAEAGARARVLKIDPHLVALAGSPKVDASAPLVVALEGGPKRGEPTLYLMPNGAVIADNQPEGGTAIVSGSKPGKLASPKAALGIDEDGMIVYVEADAAPAPSGAALDAVLTRLRCTARLWLAEPLSPLLGGMMNLAGSSAKPSGGASVKLVRATGPSGKSIFEDTPILPLAQWQPLQMKRIRYFRHAEKKDDAGDP